MGRVTKHASEDERRLAAKERKKEYAQTRKAKALRSAQNHRAYLRRTENKSTATRTWSTIPRALRKQAATPLPRDSHFFLREYRSFHEIDKDDPLLKWESFPPYRIPHGTIAKGGLAAIIESLHGRRLRNQRDAEAERLKRYQRGTDSEMLEEIAGDIERLLGDWTDLKDLIKTLSTSQIDHTMGTHLMQWVARRIVHLLEDWKAVKQGHEKDGLAILFWDRF